MIITRTPFRISFFGGGSDFPEWFVEHSAQVIGTSIDKYCYISCRYLPPFFDHKFRLVYSQIENVKEINEIKHSAIRAVLDSFHWEQGLEIHHDGDLPARSGLGSSSAFTVGLLNTLYALKGEHRSVEHLSKEATYIEQTVLQECVGCQDQILVAHGGLNHIKFSSDGKHIVSPLIVTPERKESLNDHLMLFFTGISRIASEIEKSKIENFCDNEQKIQTIIEISEAAISVLQSKKESIDDFGILLDESWRYKKALSTQVSNEKIDDAYDASKKAGALGGKLLGAGGGGFLLLFVPPVFQAAVKEVLKGYVHVPFKFESSGSKVVLYQPTGF